MVDLILCPTDRVLADVELLLDRFLADPAETGTAYLDYVPTTSPDRLVPEDLAVTLLMNSYATGATFLSIQENAAAIEERLARLPGTALEESSPELRERVVELVSVVARWPYVKVPVATKLLHKKRPALIPVLDNRAIFGALLWPAWEPPERESRADSVDGSDVARIAAALDAIYRDLVRPENESTWEVLASSRATGTARTRHASSCSTWSGGGTSETANRRPVGELRWEHRAPNPEGPVVRGP